MGEATLRVIVIFHDHGDGFWARLFGRPGFRHCFLALNDDRAWIVVDPCGDQTRISADIAADYDLAEFYRLQGHAVLETAVGPPDGRHFPAFLFTCVEVCKRALGIRGWWLWTPYQLYKTLEKNHGHIVQPTQTQGLDRPDGGPGRL